jgi:hypothetical protein
MTTRLALEDEVRRYFAERGLFLDLHTPFGRLPARFPKPYRPTSRTLEELPLWLDYWLEGRPPPLPGELELVSVEWCPRHRAEDDPLLRSGPWPVPWPEPEQTENRGCGRRESLYSLGCQKQQVRRWGLRRRRPKARVR